MSDVFYAYIKKEEIIDFARKHHDVMGLIFPSGTVLTRTFLPKKRGYKRVMIDFDQAEEWNLYQLLYFRNQFPKDVSYFTVEHLCEIWSVTERGPKQRGVIILDRIHLIMKKFDHSLEWLPLRKVTLTVTYPFPRLDDLSYQNNPVLEAVKLDDTVESIGSHSFYCCPNLRKVVISEKAFLGSSLPSSCFQHCGNLSVFIIVPSADSQLTCDVYPDPANSFLLNMASQAWFRDCPKLSELIVADTTHRIRLDKTIL